VKGETTVESQTPPGSKPPAPQQPADQPWISPRLRDKLGDADPGAPKEGPPAWLGIVLVLLVVGGGAGLFASMRSGAARQKVEAERIAQQRATEAAAESTANAARIDSMRAASAARDSAAGNKPGAATPPTATASATGSGTRAASKPAAGGSRPAASTPPAGGGAAPAPAAPAEKGPFGLDVGTYLAQDRAASELERLSAATGLKGKVVTKNEDGGEVYHVVLGSFPSRSAADKRAETLVSRSLVNQAQSVPLSP
jgi:hypothetical protein